MDTLTRETCKSIIQLINSLNITMDTLIFYHNEINEAKASNAEVKTEVEAEAEAEVKTEVEAEVKAEVKQESKKMWGDYDDDDIFVATTPAVTESIKDAEFKTVSYTHILKKHSKSIRPKKLEVTKKIKQEEEIWEEVPKEDMFTKVIKKTNGKKNVPVVYELHEFLDCLKKKQKPNIDFVIDDSAHCSHTYEGTLCNNVRNCGKIHTQRCTKGSKCTNKNCSFLHKVDMPTAESRNNFEKTMATYNKIKPNKQVDA